MGPVSSTLLRLVGVVLVLGAASADAARAQEQNTGELIGSRDIPAAVKDQVECGTSPDLITRHAFGGAYLFAWDCPRNHGNTMQALVYAERRDGTGARLLRFARPGEATGGAMVMAAEVANKRLFPTTSEIVESLVDPEAGGFCRFESRWRLIGEPKRPMLIEHRRSRDCRGVGGWVNIVPKDVTGNVPQNPPPDRSRR